MPEINAWETTSLSSVVHWTFSPPAGTVRAIGIWFLNAFLTILILRELELVPLKNVVMLATYATPPQITTSS